MMQTMKRAIIQMLIEREADCDEPFLVVVNDIPAKKGKNGCNPFQMLFPTSPERFPSLPTKILNNFFLSIAKKIKLRTVTQESCRCFRYNQNVLSNMA